MSTEDRPKSGSVTSKRRKRVPTFLFFIAPAVIILALFTLFPVIYSVRTSLFSWNLIKPLLGQQFIGIDNYVAMLSDVRFWNAVKVSLILVVGSTGLSVLIGLGLALLLNQPFKGNGFFRIVFLLPMFITPVVVGIMWRFLLNEELGLINHVIGLLGIKPIAWFSNPKLALFSVMLIDVWEWTPLVILICLSGLQALPVEPFEAAKIDGAGSWKTFLHITVPLMRPILAIVTIIRTMDAFRVFDIIYATTGGGPGVTTENLNLYGYMNAFEYYHVGYATTIALFLLIVIIVVSMMYTKVIRWEVY